MKASRASLVAAPPFEADFLTIALAFAWAGFFFDFAISECLRWEFHDAAGARLDAGEVGGGFGQHAFHEEFAGDELATHARAGAIAVLLLRERRLGYVGPHIAERNQAEEVHEVIGAGAGVVGLADGVLHEPHRGLLQMAER